MKDISQLGKSFDAYIKKLDGKLLEAQNHATQDMFSDAKERIEIPLEARNISQFLAYEQSLKMKSAEKKGSETESSVYSDLLVGGDNPKWQNVPVGAFLEWGTGPLGENSNEFPHGYDYTTEAPWDLHTFAQYEQIGTWGITARPHLYPALIDTQSIFESNVKEAIEEAWTE